MHSFIRNCHAQLDVNPDFIFSMKTPLGTKVRLLQPARLSHGFILLDGKNLQVLGGEVPHLMDEWRIQQVSCHCKLYIRQTQ